MTGPRRRTAGFTKSIRRIERMVYFRVAVVVVVLSYVLCRSLSVRSSNGDDQRAFPAFSLQNNHALQQVSMSGVSHALPSR